MVRSEFMIQMQRLFGEFSQEYSDSRLNLLFQDLKKHSLHDLVVVVDSVIYDCKTLPVPYEIKKRILERPIDATKKCEYCDDTGVRSVSLRGNPNIFSDNPILNTRVICACSNGQKIGDFDDELFAFKGEQIRWSDNQDDQVKILEKLRLRDKARLLDPTSYAPIEDPVGFFDNVISKLIKKSGVLTDEEYNKLISERKKLKMKNDTNADVNSVGNFKNFDKSVGEKIFGDFI